MTNSAIDRIWWPLRLTYGVVALAAGLDKFFNLLANWESYVSPWVASLVPGGAGALMHAVGIVEMAVGILIMTRWTRLGAYVASLWLLAVASNLLLAGFLDTAVRDIAMSVGAWTLARITELREPASKPVEAAAHPAGARA
ncbi:MAG: DoxX family membrane protein [Bryobacterales bacterium]|nr:DoxX family membrane protein [Bryobacterales bacterium]